MKKATKKIYLSLIFVGLSLLTMVATTFAWVGIVSNASFERFTINLETDNEKSDYGIMLSLTGKRDDFHDSIDAIDLQRQILINMGYTPNSVKNDVVVRTEFNKIKLALCTTTKDFDDDGAGICYYLDPFTNVEGNTNVYATSDGKETTYKGYMEFDLWVSIYKIGDDSLTSDKKLDVYLRNGDSGGILSSATASTYVSNEIRMPNSSNPLSAQYLKTVNNFEPGKVIRGEVKIKPASAARVAVQKATSVTTGDYTNYYNNIYKGLTIYKTGGDNPSYDSSYDIYDFGGVLPGDFNFARLLYNSVRNENAHLGEVPSMVLPQKRGDITFQDDGETNHIIKQSDNVTTSDMIKLHFSFWFEGWDADCFEAINDQPVTINLNFSTKNPNEA